MRTGALMLALLTGCGTEIVDLLPDAGARDASGSDLGFFDSGFDAGFFDSGFDAGEFDSGFPDSGGVDSGEFDSGVSCACIVTCTITGECQRTVGPTSTCSGGVCSGSATPSGCRSDADCTPGLECRDSAAPATSCQ